MGERVDVLLVNPWIYDFAAYDLWLRPYGLLKIGGLLRQRGYRVAFLDLLDPFYPELPKRPRRKRYGTGHFFRQEVPKPVSLEDVPRRYARYGLPPALAEKEMARFEAPQMILLTGLLTYWYPGVRATYELLKRHFPQARYFLGGVYPRLVPRHAKELFPEVEIIVSPSFEEVVKRLVREGEPSGGPQEGLAWPAFDLQREIPYVVLLTSLGCPFQCAYCASAHLFPRYEAFDPEEVWAEISYWHGRFGVKDFAFYDDALLFEFEKRLGRVLERVLEAGLEVHFHTPNAIHARFVTREVALLLKRAGFVTLRLGLETIGSRWDQKVKEEEFEQAVAYLREAGFEASQIGAYILLGLPHQELEEVREAARFVFRCGAFPVLTEYSPLPGTPLFEEARRTARYPLEDPLYQNNSLFPAWKNPPWEALWELKRQIREGRV